MGEAAGNRRDRVVTGCGCGSGPGPGSGRWIPATTLAVPAVIALAAALAVPASVPVALAAPPNARAGQGTNRDKPPKFFFVAKGGTGKNAWKLYRGNRIKDHRDLLWLKRRGVTRVVALENFRHKSLARHARKLGMVYVPRWMSRGGPNEKGRQLFGDSVTAHLAKPGHVTYVYCTFGVHRTGGIVGRFRAEQGWPCDRIMEEARRHGFRKNKYAKYRHLLKWVTDRCRVNTPSKSRRD